MAAEYPIVLCGGSHPPPIALERKESHAGGPADYLGIDFPLLDVLRWMSMEREGPEETYRVLRAIRSLAYNRQLQPLVEQRIEGAEATIRSYLLIHDTTEVQVGPYRVELDESDAIRLTRLAADEWCQLPLAWMEESLALTEESNGSGEEVYFTDRSEPLPASILYEGTRF